MTKTIYCVVCQKETLYICIWEGGTWHFRLWRPRGHASWSRTGMCCNCYYWSLQGAVSCSNDVDFWYVIICFFSFGDGMSKTTLGNQSAIIALRFEAPLLLFWIFYFSSVCPDRQPFPVPLRPLPLFIKNIIDQTFVLVVFFRKWGMEKIHTLSWSDCRIWKISFTAEFFLTPPW